MIQQLLTFISSNPNTFSEEEYHQILEFNQNANSEKSASLIMDLEQAKKNVTQFLRSILKQK
jgi:hypothetical protein